MNSTYHILLGSLISALLLISCNGTPPEDLGLSSTGLRDCPGTPNCVHTQEGRAEDMMEPLPFIGDEKMTLEALIQVMQEEPRTTIVTTELNYLHAACTTKVMKFVDDVEFYLDAENKVVHFRSASRLGKSDFGVNRERMEAISERYQELIIN